MEKVSVIVPIYNAESFLADTLLCLRAQTMQSMEVILVDDGSTDGSALICKKFTAADDRFQYVYQRNAGVSAARNRGMSEADGKYVCFCDADDAPKPEMYERLFNTIEQCNSDIVMCDYYSQRDQQNAGFPYKGAILLNGSQIRNEVIPNMIGHPEDDSAEPLIWGCVWRCIFRKDIIDRFSLRFPMNTAFAEDLVFVLRYLRHANTLYMMNEVLYLYNDRASSAMNALKQFKKELFPARKALMRLIAESLDDMGHNENMQKRMRVTFRKYILECVGNACIKSSDNTFLTAYEAIDNLLHDEVVCDIFQDYRTHNIKQRWIYSAIHYKLSIPILIYYRIRLFARDCAVGR